MFFKKNIKDIPVEETSHSSGSRKSIVTKEEITSKYFEAYTYGFLPAREKWSIHKHENIDEICVVLKGQGVVRDSNGNEEHFVEGDRFIFPANVEHEIENTSSETNEFYFFRLLDN